MSQNEISIFDTLRERRKTRDGRIVFWGSIAQLPLSAFMFWKAWSIFPQQGTDELLMAGFLHLAIPVGLIGTFIQNGSRLDFRQSAVQTFLLVLIACVPFFVSLPLLH